MSRLPNAAFAALLACLCILVSLPCAAQDRESPLSRLPWEFGPSTGRIGNRATVEVPEGYAFLGADGTRSLNEILKNPPSDSDIYTLAPQSLEWIGFFSFDELGYVRDNEKVDADEVLESIRAGTAMGNKERRKRGWETMRILGWAFSPRYDAQLKTLEWAVAAETEPSRSQVANYNTRLLGRRGVMEVVVVTDPESLEPAIADFKDLLPGYTFAVGEKYSEFRAGDRVAEIGLAALITGGAAVVAAKKGWFAALGVALAKLWKLLVVGVLGIGAAVRRMFSRQDRNKTVR